MKCNLSDGNSKRFEALINEGKISYFNKIKGFQHFFEEILDFYSPKFAKTLPISKEKSKKCKDFHPEPQDCHPNTYFCFIEWNEPC